MTRSSKPVTHTRLSTMEKIESSPYEGLKSAEVGERLFEYMQLLMEPKIDQSPSDEAIEIFGEKQAEMLLKTNRQISLSGILYSCGWKDGMIHEMNCGRLDKELLLLCLCDHRIARSDAAGTKNIVKDLEVWEILCDFMYRWKLDKKYPGLAEYAGINSFKTRQRHMLKCILFIARAAICMKYLEWDFLAIPTQNSVKTKVFQCLDILFDNATIEKPKIQKKKRPTQKARQPKASQLMEQVTPDSQSTTCLNTTINSGDCLRNTSPQVEDSSSNNRNQSELYHRLRRKGCKIVGIEFYPESKKRKRTADVTEKPTTNLIPPSTHQIESPKKTAMFSHALFATTKSGQTTKEKFVDMPKTFVPTANPSYVSDGSSMHSGSSDPNFWFPLDKGELILNPLQIETAWLVEESMYCQRSNKVDFPFLMKYASPVLQIELRKISDIDGDEDAISKLLINAIQAKRFAILRREIKRKLLKNVVRTRMQGILPRLRMSTHPLRRRKQS